MRLTRLEEGRNRKEKIVTYLRSRLFPWNFILEKVEEDAIKHFLSYTIQIGKIKNIGKFSNIERGRLKKMITKEVKDIINDYLYDPYDKDALKKHGKFAHEFPFAFPQGLVHIILHWLGIKIEDVVDEKAVVELIGGDVKGIKRKEIFITGLISSLLKENELKGVYSRSFLDKKVLTLEGDYVGNVEDLIFDSKTGSVKELIVISQKSFRKKVYSISIKEIKLNMYSGKFVFKSLS